MKKQPILILNPHGGVQIPDELEKYIEASELEMFMGGDSCANELFSFGGAKAVLDFHISKMLVDLNRSPFSLPPSYSDGVIKTLTPQGRNLFEDEICPDEIAIANILRRYYFPYHETAAKIVSSDEIKLIIECHTIPAVGYRDSYDADKPMPLIKMWYVGRKEGKPFQSSPRVLCELIMDNLQDYFRNEQSVAEESFLITEKENAGELVSRYATRIPYIRLDICKSLFLNDTYFNPYYKKVDQIRIKYLREKIWSAIEKGTHKFGII